MGPETGEHEAELWDVFRGWFPQGNLFARKTGVHTLERVRSFAVAYSPVTSGYFSVVFRRL